MDEKEIKNLYRESLNEVVGGVLLEKLKKGLKKIGTNLLPVGVLTYRSQKKVKEVSLPDLNCKANSIVTRLLYAFPLEYYLATFPGFSWSYTSQPNYAPCYGRDCLPPPSNTLSFGIPAWLPNDLGYLGMALSMIGVGISLYRPVGTLVIEGIQYLRDAIARQAGRYPNIKSKAESRLKEKLISIETQQMLRTEEESTKRLHELTTQLYVAKKSGDESAVRHLKAEINDIRMKRGLEELL